MGLVSSKQQEQQRYDYWPEDWPWVWAILDGSVLDWKNGLSDDEVSERAMKQRELPVRIRDDLFLGNSRCVSEINKLQRLGITHVLNLAGPMALKSSTIRAYRRAGIEYLQLDADDEEGYPLLEKHWQSAHDFIGKAESSRGKKCVVHCVAGMNRSGLVVAAHYMITEKVPVLQAVKHVRKERGNVALQNRSFQEQLVALARRHDLLGPEPGTPGSVVEDQVPPPPEAFPKRPEKEKYSRPLDILAG